jgi:predicted amidophosphoribosyltransferase
MRVFLRALSSIIFDSSDEINIKTQAFKSFRFGIPIYAGAKLTSELSHIALRAKEDNDLIARKFLAKLLVDAIELSKETDVTIIMVPSRKEVSRYRGIKHINELVKEVSRDKKIQSYDVLRHSRKVLDQSKLTYKERMENLAGAFIVPSYFKELPRKAFLIDDLVTSGATILAASKALQVRNIQLLGVLAACASMVFTE